MVDIRCIHLIFTHNWLVPEPHKGLKRVTRVQCSWIFTFTIFGNLSGRYAFSTRADKGWAVKRARPSKKVWCSGLGLCLEMSLVFDFGHGLRCGLSIRHCRCHWIMATWSVFLHFFLFPLCWYAVSERQVLLFFFARGLVGREWNISFKGFLLLLPWL